MRRRFVLWLVTGFGICVFSQTAHAGMFGKQEELTTIQDTKDPKYKLGYKVTMVFVFGGVSVHDDGYVLLPAGEYKKYIPLDDEKIRGLQADGVLPDPMPHYSLSVFQYLFGYSLWIIIGGIILFSAIGKVFKKSQETPTMGSAPNEPKSAT